MLVFFLRDKAGVLLILKTIQLLLINNNLHNPNTVYVGYIALDLIASSYGLIEPKRNVYSLIPWSIFLVYVKEMKKNVILIS